MEKYLDFHIILIKPVLMLVSGVANRVSASLVNGSLKCLPVGTGVIGILRYDGEVLNEVMLKVLTGSWNLESLDVEPSSPFVGLLATPSLKLSAATVCTSQSSCHVDICSILRPNNDIIKEVPVI